MSTKNSKKNCFYIDEWLKLESWDLMSACFLVFGMNPDTKFHTNEDKLNYDEHQKFYQKARSQLGKKLKVITKETFYEPAQILPHDLVNWAADYISSMPIELTHLLKKKKIDKSSIATKERKSLLQIIYVLAHKANLGIEDTFDDFLDKKKIPAEVIKLLSPDKKTIPSGKYVTYKQEYGFESDGNFYKLIKILADKNNISLEKHYRAADMIIQYAADNDLEIRTINQIAPVLKVSNNISN